VAEQACAPGRKGRAPLALANFWCIQHYLSFA